jgi:hypothetical protein
LIGKKKIEGFIKRKMETKEGGERKRENGI